MNTVVKEIRIGNYLDELNEIVIVGFDTFKHFKQMPNLMNYNLKPITLDINWLLNLGFTREGNTFTYKMNSKIDERKIGFQISIKKGLFIYYAGLGQFINIKYVHQLQNLYFALINEELTAK